jgi:hypothetical protein
MIKEVGMTSSGKFCPICKKRNKCGNVGKVVNCWCFNEVFPEGIFKFLSDDQRNKACICKECLDTYKGKL